MKYRKLLSVVLAFCLVCSFSACNKKDKSEKEKPAPPAPVEATDENSITFDDGNFKFASILDSDYKAAKGSLSVEEVQGNPMLKFTDSGDSFKNDLIQKIRISMLPIMSPENIAKVDSIEFDFYADAVDDSLVADDGSHLKVPGWIGGGGGTEIADEESWYSFAEFSATDYTNEMSGACHVKFKFFLAKSGKKWSAEMEDPNFLIMRWGLQNNSNIYVDNITFYDENGKSLPLNIQGGS
ncbi:MAG: hypothetical protein E7499_06730 [Ruminococcus sp.]|nr:hypothetical protein [Ruminococcus sp.]